MMRISNGKKTKWLSVMLLLVTLFTASCSDDIYTGNEEDNTIIKEDTTAVSLTFHNFISADDLLIIDADTTMISVSKKFAERLGIEHFNGRPMAIWQKINCLPFICRATSEKEENGRYILTVDRSASLADVLPEDAEVNLDTKIFVNPEAKLALTRTGGSNLVEDVSTRYMEEDTIHPAVILYTDPRGYDEDAIILAEDGPQTGKYMTRSGELGEYEYATADNIHKKDADWGIINKKTAINSTFKLDAKAGVSVGLNLPIETRVNVKMEIKTKKLFKLKKFDMGVYGGFSFKPELNIGFSKEYKIPSDKGTMHLADFPGYTAVFMVGIVPVSVRINPGIIFKIDGSLKGSVNTGFTYRYENEFKVGIKYENSWGPYGEYKVKENKFAMNAINANAQLKTGVGFYLSIDAMLYGFAGPEIAIGPNLSLNANASITVPTHGDPYSQFDANLNFGLKALIGAKLKIRKWTLADWNTTFAISPEWEIWKYSTTL